MSTTDFQIADKNDPDILKNAFDVMINTEQDIFQQSLPTFLKHIRYVKSFPVRYYGSALLQVVKYSNPKKRLNASKMLLDAGAEVLYRNRKGKTVLKTIAAMNLDMTVKENKEFMDMIQTAVGVAEEGTRSAVVNDAEPRQLRSNKRKSSEL